MQAPASAYSLQITVQPEHIDILNHVNNVVYLNWVQDAAVGHWEALAPRDMQESMFWVVRRHEIDYLRSAKLGDVITVSTWVGREIDGYFERFTHIARESDATTLVEALTLWCPMHMSTGRRMREIPDDVRELASIQWA